MLHPWDLLCVFRYSTSFELQVQCVSKGILGAEAAQLAKLELVHPARANAESARRASAQRAAATRRRRL